MVFLRLGAGPLQESASLLDEASPGLPSLIAQDDPVAIRHAGYGVPIWITESVANRLLAHFFGGASPDISVFVAQLQMITVAESVQPRAGGFFLEAKESARNFAVDSTALEDTFTSHTPLFGQWAKLWDEVFALVARNAVTYRAWKRGEALPGSAGFGRKCNINGANRTYASCPPAGQAGAR